MEKDEIIREIRRTAQLNGGVPIGKNRFSKETGITEYDLTRFWSRWSDAVIEAGFSPNTLQGAYDEAVLIEKYIGLARELKRLPTPNDIRFRSRNSQGFPNEATFRARFGGKPELIKSLFEVCRTKSEYNDIAELCEAYLRGKSGPAEEGEDAPTREGFVYLFKHGSRPEYKIGKTYNPIRREGEIAVQLPGRLEPIHFIQTDDPSGVEAYWHRRFAAKRLNAEWFALSAMDVKAFKKWRKIC